MRFTLGPRALTLIALLWTFAGSSCAGEVFRLFPERPLSPPDRDGEPRLRLALRSNATSGILDGALSRAGEAGRARPSARVRSDAAEDHIGGPSSGWRPTSLVRGAALALISATAVGVSTWNSVRDEESRPFHVTREGFFGRNTYTGGVDKASHFVDYYTVARGGAEVLRDLGYERRKALWLGAGVAALAGLTTELGDGHTPYGFSPEDLLFDVLGAGTAVALRETGWDDTFGFRAGGVRQDGAPACCIDESNQGRDYSGEIYTADVKIAGLARRLRIDPGPARFLLFSTTYGTNGYKHAAPALRQRLFGLELGINLPEIARAVGVTENRAWGRWLLLVLEYLRFPYTAIGYRYDLNHGRWYGPTTGHTPFANRN